MVTTARAQGLNLPVPTDVVETPGEGVADTRDGDAIAVGGEGFLAARTGIAAWDMKSQEPGAVLVAGVVDGRPACWLVMADCLRVGIGDLLAGQHHHGIPRIVLATGDRHAVEMSVSQGLPLDAVHADLTPDQMVLRMLSERKNGPVMMVGDGLNDAPALATAGVGVVMGARSAAASAEAAYVVLLVDRLDRLLPALVDARGASRSKASSPGSACRS
ncbi:HAD family hydrolase [Paracoccus sp. 1_MG-2023]|uniref:HAD family hydrolase n=1 Tax=unclassified Paracoccus (in: a-proteobacteria) TaxID=2688777 RepID=UPI0034C6965C